MHKLAPVLMCAALACSGARAADTARPAATALTPAAPLQKFEGAIRGYATTEYRIAVPARAPFDVKLTSANRSAYFNVTVAGADQALFVGARDGDRFHASAPAATEYVIKVYLMRNAARRSETAKFVLQVDVGVAGVAGAAGAQR